jgi:hypothetical protein
LAKVPGSAAACALLLSLAAATDLADGSAVNCPCVGAEAGGGTVWAMPAVETVPPMTLASRCVRIRFPMNVQPQFGCRQRALASTLL